MCGRLQAGSLGGPGRGEQGVVQLPALGEGPGQGGDERGARVANQRPHSPIAGPYPLPEQRLADLAAALMARITASPFAKMGR